MNEQNHIYKRYTSQVKHNSIILLKQQKFTQNKELKLNQQRHDQKFSGLELKNGLNQSFMEQQTNQKNFEPLVLKKFEDYFKKNSQPIRNIKILNKVIHTNVNPNTGKPSQRYLPLPYNQSFRLVKNDKQGQQKAIKDRKSQIHTSRGKKTLLNSTVMKQKLKNYLQKPDQANPNNLTSASIISKNKKRQRLNNSIDLCRLLNSPIKQINKFQNQFKLFKNFVQESQAQQSNYLRIQKSYLTQRKMMSTQLTTNDDNKKTSKQQQLKKTIREKIMNRKKALQQTYKDKMRSRSPSPNKYPKITNFINYINPTGKQEFMLPDLLQISMINSNVDEVKMNMNGCFFSVYVQQGNGSELIKSIVRSISGWRVAQIPSVANLVWTQGYRKNLAQKKPKQIVRDAIVEDYDQLKRSRSHSRQKVSKQKTNQSFLRSRKLDRRNSNLSNSSQKRASHKLLSPSSRKKLSASVNQNYPQLSFKSINRKQQFLYQKQVKKLLPVSFQIDKYVIKKQKDFKKLTITPNFLIHNHMIGHRAISDKKNLLFNLRKFYYNNSIDPFKYIPQSHDIRSLSESFILKQSQNYFKSNSIEQMKKQVWIIKPGEDSNRGRGIVICKGWQQAYKQISKRVKDKQDNLQLKASIENNQSRNAHNNSQSQSPQKSDKQSSMTKRYEKTVILQRYIVPMLYNGRKFDIRSYMLVTWVNNTLNGYVYQQCYIRTSSKQFDIDSQNKYVHLTNDAIQSLSHQYGKYEQGNKVSQILFQKYFNQHGQKMNRNWKYMRNQMTLRCQDILKSSSKKLTGKFAMKQNYLKQTLGYNIQNNIIKSRHSQSLNIQQKQKAISLFNSNTIVQKPLQMAFQLFGLDFMIDQELKLWLIQVNTNPAITHDCSRVLGRLIPRLLQNTLQVAVMPYMRPSRVPQNSGYFNRYSHIYKQVIMLE